MALFQKTKAAREPEVRSRLIKQGCCYLQGGIANRASRRCFGIPGITYTRYAWYGYMGVGIRLIEIAIIVHRPRARRVADEILKEVERWVGFIER